MNTFKPTPSDLSQEWLWNERQRRRLDWPLIALYALLAAFCGSVWGFFALWAAKAIARLWA